MWILISDHKYELHYDSTEREQQLSDSKKTWYPIQNVIQHT
jgi:hypothetical protein